MKPFLEGFRRGLWVAFDAIAIGIAALVLLPAAIGLLAGIVWKMISFHFHLFN